jgi:hypothetical protein
MEKGHERGRENKMNPKRNASSHFIILAQDAL